MKTLGFILIFPFLWLVMTGVMLHWRRLTTQKPLEEIDNAVGCIFGFIIVAFIYGLILIFAH